MLRTLVALLGLSTLAAADVSRPGSVLVFPLHDSVDALTLISVTNVNTAPSTPFGYGGDTRATFRYVNTVPNPENSLKALHCSTRHRAEDLTPGDTVTILTRCHNGIGERGYLVVYATAPVGGRVSHNYLVGSGLVVHPQGTVDTIVPYVFRAIPGDGDATDIDADGRLDFDNVEYEAMPNELYADNFIGLAGTGLTLFNLTGDEIDLTTVKLDIFNDNEFPLSYTFTMKCWFEVPLVEINQVFSQSFLAGTPNDPNEVDVNCDQVGDAEAGWFRIRGLTVSNGFSTILDPVVLGSLTGRPGAIEGGRPLWGDGTNTSAEI